MCNILIRWRYLQNCESNDFLTLCGIPISLVYENISDNILIQGGVILSFDLIIESLTAARNHGRRFMIQIMLLFFMDSFPR